MYNKSIDLKQKRASYYDAASNIVAKAEKEGRPLTSIELHDITRLTEKMQNVNDMLRDAGDDAPAPITEGSPQERLQKHGEHIESRHSKTSRAGLYSSVSGLDANVNPRSYRAMFAPDRPSVTLPDGGFRSFNEFIEAVSNVQGDGRLQRAHVEKIGSSGGFAVPERWTQFLLDKSLESEIVRPLATVWPMDTEIKKVPAFDGSNHTSGLYGGLTATWLDEATAGTETHAKLRLMELSAKKLACFTSASNELVSDGMSFEDQLGAAMIKTVGWYLDSAFLNGTGAGMPRGVLHDPALLTVAKESGQAAATVTFDNFCRMFERMHPACRSNAVWIANSSLIPSLLTMSVSIGTGGQFIPAMSQSTGAFSLLTRPILFTEKLPVLGQKGDVLFCDFSQYAIGLRREVTLEKSSHVGFMSDVATYRSILRADGQGMWNSAITPKNGNSVSWAVTLAART